MSMNVVVQQLHGVPASPWRKSPKDRAGRLAAADRGKSWQVLLYVKYGTSHK